MAFILGSVSHLESHYMEERKKQLKEEQEAKGIKISDFDPQSELQNGVQTEFQDFEPILRKKDSFIENFHKKDEYYIQNLIYGISISNSDSKCYIRNCHTDIKYALTQLQSPPQSYIEKKQINLPSSKSSGNKVLFISLEDTLVHKCKLEEKPDHIIDFRNSKNQRDNMGLNIRPYLFKFLKKLSQYWDIYIFSSFPINIVKGIVSFLDPLKKYIKGILTRDQCMKTNRGYYIKDLRIIKNRDLTQIAIIDSNVTSFAFQIDNGIPIINWENDKKDEELLYIVSYLIQLSFSDDIRTINREKFKLKELGSKHLFEIQL